MSRPQRTPPAALLACLVLALAGPALVAQLRRPLPRLAADALEYYAQLRSLYHDRDLDLANEFAHFGILDRWDKRVPTATGYRRTIFSVGPALLWLPFYAAGDVSARIAGAALDNGYSAWHQRAVALGSLCYAVWGLLLVHAVLARVLPRAPALWAVLLLFYGTFLWWYTVVEPLMSHACSFFVAAAVLRVWWPGRTALQPGRGLALGALVGLAACVRWQNAVLLSLPAASLLAELVRGRVHASPDPGGSTPDGVAPRWRAGVLVLGLGVLAAAALGALPQMLAWRAVFGSYLLADPPHGRDFLRLDHPFWWQTFYSSRHGLFYWTPLLWAGYLGLAGYLRRERFTALALGVPVLLMSYVNACSGDWWAGGSFSNRRFDSLLPALALGLGVALDTLRRLLASRPWLLPAAPALALVAWNALSMQSYRRNLVPRDESIEFARLAESNAALVAETVGAPTAWPANWVFAYRHRLSPARYDLMVGKYLFYRQNNLGGVLDLGDPRADPALRDDGWSALRPCGPQAECRAVRGVGRLFAPLDVPETLDLAVHARGTGSLRMALNGVPAAVWPLPAELRALRVRLPAARWRRELNELSFAVGPGEGASLDKLVFSRVPQ